jgi:drug/metabolite transporter (DMT)-like permease
LQTTNKNRASDHTKGVVACLCVVICWTGFNIITRFGAKNVFTPFDLGALRFSISGIIALPIFLYLVPKDNWSKYIVLSIFGGLGYSLFVYSGFVYAPSAHAGVFVNGGIPFWAAILVAFSSQFKMPKNLILALALSTIGLLMIGFDSLFVQSMDGEWRGDILFFIAALTWAVFGFLIRRWQIRPFLAMLGIASFAAVIYLPIYILWLPKTILSASFDQIALQGFYQGIVAALFAGGMYGYAVQKIGTREAAMLLTLVPALSALGGYFFLAESLTWIVILGVAIVSLAGFLGAIPAANLNKEAS